MEKLVLVPQFCVCYMDFYKVKYRYFKSISKAEEFADKIEKDSCCRIISKYACYRKEAKKSDCKK